MTKSLSKAIALATALGAAASAHAININQDGLGEVLLYSLYTTEQGNNTNVRITNTTPYAKAVKVRFVEGQNSQEVLDFNLYLSPYDQWSGAVTQTETGAKLITADKSCTVPEIPAAGEEFRNYEYSGKGGEQSTKRTRVGHIEVIEMGVLEAGLAAMVTANHEVAGSAPANCAGIANKFKTPSDPWYDPATAKPKGSIPATTPQNLQAGIVTEIAGKRVTGGLYGSANIVNVDGATQISYDAVAVDNFLYDSVHNLPGLNAPDLDSGQTNGSSTAVFKNGKTATFLTSAPAVSALLMKEAMNNDFVVSDALKAETNWVVTFPTKRFHVNTLPATAPFVNSWNRPTAGKSCHTVDVKYWDHEEYDPKGKVETGDIDFSPLPPTIEPDAPALPALCYETNIITFNDKKVLGGEFVTYNLNLPEEYQLGWMELGFTSDKQATPVVPYELTSVDAVTSYGLPAIGFAATTVKNNNASGVMKNYGSSIQHKSKTTFDH